MQKTFRLKEETLKTGILCLFGFLAMGTFSVVTTMLAPPPNARLAPIYMAMFFSLFWGAWSCLAIWILLAHWRERLTVNDETVIQRGVFRTRVIRFNEIDKLVWRPAQTQARLFAGTTRLKIHFVNSSKADQLSLIQHVQQRIPNAVQVNWEMFCTKVAVPLSMYEAGCLAPGQVTVTRKRWARYFIPATLLFAVLGVVASLTLQMHRMLIAPVPMLLLWALLHFSTPRKGLAASRIDAEPESGRFLLFLLVWAGGGFTGLLTLIFLDPKFPAKTVWLIIGGTIWFGLLITRAVQLDRLRQRNDRTRIPDALKEWSEADSKCQP